MASRKPHAKFFTSLALMGALAGVLIWSKLRLSTNMPRSAYADPKDSQVEPDAAAGTASDPVASGAASPTGRHEASQSEDGTSVEDRAGG